MIHFNKQCTTAANNVNNQQIFRLFKKIVVFTQSKFVYTLFSSPLFMLIIETKQCRNRRDIRKVDIFRTTSLILLDLVIPCTTCYLFIKKFGV